MSTSPNASSARFSTILTAATRLLIAIACVRIVSTMPDASAAEPTPAELPQSLAFLCDEAPLNEYPSKYLPTLKKVCSHFARAWQDRDPHAEGTELVVDLSELNPEGTQIHNLPATFLNRLIRANISLPDHLVGGIRLRNLSIDGGIRLHYTTSRFPLILDHAQIVPKVDDAGIEIFYSDLVGLSVVNKSVVGNGIHIQSSILNKYLLIKDSYFHITDEEIQIQLLDTKIGGNLEIVNNDFALSPPGGYFRTLNHDAMNSLEVRQVKISGDFEIIGNKFPREVNVYGSQSSEFHFINNRYQGGIQFNQNFGRSAQLVTQYPIALPMRIQDNQFDSRFFIQAASIHTGRSDEAYINQNRIGGNFYIRLAVQGGVLSGDVSTIDASYNTVDGAMEVILPRTVADAEGHRTQVMSLSGTRVGGKLTLAADACPDGASARSALEVELGYIDVSGLMWAVPDECEVSWIGKGIEFREWVPNASSDPELDGGASRIVHWIRDQGRRDPEMLHYVGNYLLAKGYTDQARDMLEDAKAMHYRPEIWGNGDPTKQTNGFGALLDVVTWVYLYPTGYGAKPERALVVLFIVWVFSLGIYMLYLLLCKAKDNRKDTASQNSSGIIGSIVERFGVAKTGEEGESMKLGFWQFDAQKMPKDFSIWVYTTDAMLPFINLHAYDAFYPVGRIPKFVAGMQHFIGWWMFTSFVASAAVLVA